MSNFAFLKTEWPALHEAASKAESLAYPDARAACFYARRTLELAVHWLYKHDSTLKLPYQDHLSALIHEPTFRNAVGPAVFAKACVLKDLGNLAVHSHKPVRQYDSLAAGRELFHFCFWFARTYSRGVKPADGLTFNPELLPKAAPVPPQTQEQLQRLETQLLERDEKLSELLADKTSLDEELKRLRSEVAEAKKANAAQPDNHDYSEAETRDYFIDLLLKEAGWALDQARDREFEVSGMPRSTAVSPVSSTAGETNPATVPASLPPCGGGLGWGETLAAKSTPTLSSPTRGEGEKGKNRVRLPNPIPSPHGQDAHATGKGFVDYVLWGDDGVPLALVEAKRTKRDPRGGQQQAKLYADCLEKRFRRRPIIFYTNGYEHWLWDDANYPPRPVQGFYKKAELELLIQRRKTRKPLAEVPINETIVERYYQTRAIRRIGEAFEKDNDRKALIVMATGAGKTRTVIALCDLLLRCNWVKRVLFLADRKALVRQAVNAFKKHLPESSPVNLVTEKNTEGRVFVSTYPTMMGLIDETHNEQRRFGVGHFDLVIIDEAHRSVYQKYRAIFEYFDSILVGLTATPRDEIDRNTYGLFDLEKGVPTDAYDLNDAVADKFLVPSQPISVPLKFQREGIKYNDLSEEEKAQWDELDWDEEGRVPDQVGAEAVNKWLFNKDTVDKVLEHVMTRGQKVAGGDRIGKTIIFAKNQAHAEYIAERFDANYPHLKGKFARAITFKTEYAQSLIDEFSLKNKAPHLAISVDMLDTGIDVPEVVNLVFFKQVWSKTKFWQMIGRGTRLCPDLFAPGKNKEFFYIFDYCQNLEFFGENPETTAGSSGASLGKRLFNARLEVIVELDKRFDGALQVRESETPEETLRRDIAALLHGEVAAMNLNNFMVRAKRRLVEKYAKLEAWTKLKMESFTELAGEVSGLPSELAPEDEEAKRFDLLLLNLQLAVLRFEPTFQRLREQVKAIAGLLEEKSGIPMVREQMSLIQAIQNDEWWRNVTAPLLENVRRRLRALIKLIEKRRRKFIYTDFEDELGGEKPVELPNFTSTDSYERFLAKTRLFLREHENDPVIHKLRMNEPLTAPDLLELERILTTSGPANPEHLRKAKEESNGLGLFVRSLVGLDREAAKRAVAGFIAGKPLTANQIQFVNLIVNHLTEHGVMNPKLLYESPFTDFTPKGPESLFSSIQVDQLVAALTAVKNNATAA
jgi:type I restriction enzyme R subunit